MRNNPIKGNANTMNDTTQVVISQSVVNPVGSKENTDEGPEKWNPPMDMHSSDPIVLSQNVINPVGSSMNTDKGTYQEPLPMRPIPS